MDESLNIKTKSLLQYIIKGDCMKYLFIYVAIINLIGFFIMGIDKKRAIKKRYRISEKKLFMIALIGGSLGSTLGMKKFRHKTKHWYFKYGMPTIFLIQLLLLVLLTKGTVL